VGAVLRLRGVPPYGDYIIQQKIKGDLTIGFAQRP